MPAINLFPTLAETIQVSDRCFDKTTTALIGQAFDCICKGLPKGCSDAISREIVAKRIIYLASRGERDPEKMGNEALICLGLKPNRFTVSTPRHHP
jgi:hypothetical protein